MNRKNRGGRFIVAIALAAATCACGMQAGASPTPSPSATASLTSAAPSSPPPDEPSATPEVAGVSFERVFELEGASLGTIAAVPGGYIAGGCRHQPVAADGSWGGCREALLLSSPDGRSWSEVSLPEAEGRGIAVVAHTHLGLLALGSNGGVDFVRQRAAWRSVDGTTWELFTMPAPETVIFERVVGLSDRTLLVGADAAEDFVRAHTWATADGSSWTSGQPPIVPVIDGGTELVSVGKGCGSDTCEADSPTRVWRSIDGFEWAEETIPDDFVATAYTAFGIRNGRTIVGGTIGTDSSRELVLWHDDEMGWRRTTLEGGAGYLITSILDIAERHLVIASSDTDGPPIAWWSADTLVYERVELLGLGDHVIVGAAGHDPLVTIIEGQKELWAASF